MSIFLFINCAGPALTPEGEKVRIIDVEGASCRELGQIEARDFWSGSKESILAKLKNQAAKKGGDTIVLENRPPWFEGNQNPTTALVYRCRPERHP